MDNLNTSNTDSTNLETLFPLETCPPAVSDEVFNTFHTIDRDLYARLIKDLGRDPAESMQVMALWMWTERNGYDSSLIKKMLTLPLPMINQLANEAVTCMQCIETDVFIHGNHEITLLPELVGVRRDGSVVSLKFFHENRITVLRGVSKIITTVCARAFNDILIRVLHGKEVAVAVTPQVMPKMRSVGTGAFMPMMYPPPYGNVPFVPMPMGNGIGIPMHMLNLAAYDFAMQRQMLSGDLGEIFGRNLSLGNDKNIPDDGKLKKKYNAGGDCDDIPADDRTVFLTFSKGYLITEDEVRSFFTRKFGDFIEVIIMQDVADDVQPLFARMVVARRSIGVIDAIVGGGREKYAINGKHVWARKYVKKSQNSVRSPPRGGDSPPSGSNPN